MVEIKDKGLSLPSNEMQEVLGPIPCKITYIGIIIFSLIILFVFICCTILKVQNKIQTNVIISYMVSPVEIHATENGSLFLNNLDNKMNVSEKQLLAQIIEKDTFNIISPISGTLETSTPLIQYKHVLKGEKLFTILPEKQSSPIAYGFLNSEQLHHVVVGLNIDIVPTQFPKEKFGVIRGKINSISIVPNSDGLFYFDIKLYDGLKTSTSLDIPLLPNMKCVASIILSEETILQKIFPINL